MRPRAHCKTCDKQLGPANRSGYCTKHVSAANAADPEWRRKQREGARLSLHADPQRLERARQIIAINGSLPQAVEGRRRVAIEQRIWEKGHAHLAANPEARIRGGQRQSDTKLAWCPRELRDDYRKLVLSSRVPAAEARVMIMERHEREMAAFRRKLLDAAA